MNAAPLESCMAAGAGDGTGRQPEESEPRVPDVSGLEPLPVNDDETASDPRTVENWRGIEKMKRLVFSTTNSI